MITAQAIQTLYEYNLSVIGLNVNGMSHAESLIEPQPEGNTLNWVLGHIIANRQAALDILGRPRTWDQARVDRYQTGSDPATAETPGTLTLEELLADLQRSQEQIVAGLAAADQEMLDQSTGDGTPGEYLIGLAWHEAYHAGQTDYLRRLAGKAEGGVR